MFAALSDLQPAERWREVTEALSADEMSALYQKMQASPALYGDDMHRLMHTAQQVEGRAANLFTRLCAAETAIEQLQRTRNVMEPAPVRFDFEADNLRQQLDDLRAHLAAGTASDGHHTHNELYQYRMLYNILALHGFMAVGWEVTRSWRHHSGEECFGGGWFVVQAHTPAGQVTNHYQADHWYLFDGIPDPETSPAWDGHTPPIAAQRLEAAITFLRQAFAQQKESDEATQLRSQLDGLRRAYDHACAQRDKYMRRTAEWRSAALDGTAVTTACTGCGQCDYCQRKAADDAED